MFQYLKEHPTYTIVFCAILVACGIVIAIISACYKNKKKKAKLSEDKKIAEIKNEAIKEVDLNNSDKLINKENCNNSNLEQAIYDLSKKEEQQKAEEKNNVVAEKVKTTTKKEDAVKYENPENKKLLNQDEKEDKTAIATVKNEEKSLKDEKNNDNLKKETKKEIEKKPENDEEQTVKYAGKWVISKEDDGRFVADLKASNGELMLRSESYSSLSGMKSGIETLKKNIEKENFAISLDKNGNFVFKIFSTANRLLCIGEGYSTREQCEKAFSSVKRFSKTAVIVVSKDEQ